MGEWWYVIEGLAGVFCIVRAAFDFRERRFVWGVAGLLFAAALLSPAPAGHAVTVTLAVPPPVDLP